MSYNVAVIGDQHFKIDNIDSVDMYIDEVVNAVKTMRPRFIVLLGDLLDTHERIHSIPLNRAYTFIGRLRDIAKLFILVGNHDMINHLVFLTPDHWLNGLKEWTDVTVVDNVVNEMVEGDKFIFTPYVFPGRFMEALNTSSVAWRDARCIFAHQEFHGCKMGATISIEGDKWPLEFPRVVSGHIHSTQTPQNNIYYPGSSLPVAFGETTRNMIARLEFNQDNDGYILHEIELKLPRKRIVYTSTDTLSYVVIDTETKDTIKLSVSGEYNDFKNFKKTQQYKELTEQGVKVVFKQTRGEIELAKNIVKDALNDTSKGQTTAVPDFKEILQSLIVKEENKHLREAYELVVNNAIVDVLIIV